MTIYMKPASDSTYPSEPSASKTLSGNSGTDTLSIEAVGDDAYDFKVQFYDGTDTYIAFPSVTSNVRLVTIDENGCVEIAGHPTNCSWVYQRDYAALRKIRKCCHNSFSPLVGIMPTGGSFFSSNHPPHLQWIVKNFQKHPIKAPSECPYYEGGVLMTDTLSPESSRRTSSFWCRRNWPEGAECTQPRMASADATPASIVSRRSYSAANAESITGASIGTTEAAGRSSGGAAHGLRIPDTPAAAGQ